MALNEQTEMAFGELSTRIDPVSGNEVPPGAMPEEVRDDIPAQLSEGEYVVPADVLQYYGIKFFEDLRSNAKKDLATLESSGRMGGEPIEREDDLPFSDEELNIYDDADPMQANLGGMVRGYEEGGTVAVRPGASQREIVLYVNDATGEKQYIQFVMRRGKLVAIPPIPPGFRRDDTPAVAAPVAPVAPVAGGANSNQDEEDTDGKLFVGWENMRDADLLQMAIETTGTVHGIMGKAGFFGKLLGGQDKKFEAEMDRRLNDPKTTSGTRELIKTIRAAKTKPKNIGRRELEALMNDIKGPYYAQPHTLMMSFKERMKRTKFLEEQAKKEKKEEEGNGVVVPVVGVGKGKTPPTVDDDDDDYAYDPNDTWTYQDDPNYAANEVKRKAAAEEAERDRLRNWERQAANDAKAELGVLKAAAAAAREAEANQKAQDEYDRDERNRGYDTVRDTQKEPFTFREKVGGGYTGGFNKGGLASKKKKSKKK